MVKFTAEWIRLGYPTESDKNLETVRISWTAQLEWKSDMKRD